MATKAVDRLLDQMARVFLAQGAVHMVTSKADLVAFVKYHERKKSKAWHACRYQMEVALAILASLGYEVVKK
jgi:hypothetical protein